MSPRTAAFALASLLALAIAADLLWMPVQVSDSLDEILDARISTSAWASFEESLRSDDSHLRPLRVVQTKLLYDAAAGDAYWLPYRGFHAALLFAGVLLFTAVQRVATPIDLAASAFALVVFVGSRTFRGNIQEAFPVDHFLEVVVLCLATVNLARSRGGWWADVAAALAFCVAALTLESGLLVWVVAVGAWIVGWRGISARGLVAMTVLLAAYVYLQIVYLAGVPGLPDRSTGFGFTMLEPAELQQRFGDEAALLYVYNVAASALSVLFSEPSNGVFLTARAAMMGELLPRLLLPAMASTATTIIVFWAAVRWVRQRVPLDDNTRFIALSAIVLAANAMVSYSYTKDETMGVAGAFYALAAFAAVRCVLMVAGRAPQRVAATIVVAVAILTLGWSVRAAGMHYLMRAQAFRHQNDWVHTPGDWRRSGKWPEDQAAQALIQQLRGAAVALDVPNPGVGEPRWVGRVWED